MSSTSKVLTSTSFILSEKINGGAQRTVLRFGGKAFQGTAFGVFIV